MDDERGSLVFPGQCDTNLVVSIFLLRRHFLNFEKLLAELYDCFLFFLIITECPPKFIPTFTYDRIPSVNLMHLSKYPGETM